MTFSLGCVLKTELRRRAEVRSKLFLLNLHSPKALFFVFLFLHFYVSGGVNSSLIVKLVLFMVNTQSHDHHTGK